LAIKFDDINTWGTIATFVGLAISIVTLLVANNVRKATQRLQNSIVFDKRVPSQLKAISMLLSDFNILLNNTGANVNQIKSLLSLMKSEIFSLSNKITDKRIKKLIFKTVKRIDSDIHKNFIIEDKNAHLFRKAFNSIFTVSEDDYWKNYTAVGEIHRAIDNLYKDKKATVKP